MKKIQNSWLYNLIPEEQYKSAINMVNSSLVAKAINKKTDINFELLNKVEEVLELILTESLNDVNNNEKIITELSEKLYTLFSIKPLPADRTYKMKHIIYLIIYAYLGEKWESGRQFLIDNKQDWKINISDNESWNIRLFTKTYNAFVHLVRKKGWEDLEEACNIINDLRQEQKLFEKEYLNNIDNGNKLAATYELMSLYHLAKVIDLMACFMISGEEINIREQIDLHFSNAIDAADNGAIISMGLLLRTLKVMLHKMISNSIWTVTQKVNSRVTKFVENLVRQKKPVFELMYPQKQAILSQGLLDPAHKAVVVNMPTSSGKTLIAQFRILQALNQFSDDNGWVVYVAPTRALVNQITLKFQKEFGPIGIKVEKMSGAIEIDSFEENLLSSQENKFDVLVTTPEKLNLLIRDKIESKIGRPLALAVIDEAHNLEEESRGLNLEFLLSNIKNDSPKANFLLLTPFIENSEEVARWLDDDSPKSISVSINWKPNERVLGAMYPEGSRRDWCIYYKTLLTNNSEIDIEEKLQLSSETPIDRPRSKLTKSALAAGIAKQMIDRKGILLIARTLKDCWSIAEMLEEELTNGEPDEDIELVKRFIAAEFGENFKLINMLDKRIAVHNSGLSDEIKLLIEWLMEKGKLDVLVATTTIAQGINFPVSTIIMASYSYPWTSQMPVRDFWNLVGRAGRADQGEIGLIGVVIGEKREKQKEKELNKLATYVRKNTENLISQLSKIVNNTVKIGEHFNLSSQFFKPEWSQFLQYITHMFNQCKELSEFEQKSNLFLRRTFGYNSIQPEKQKILLKAVKEYGKKLNKNRGMARLSDLTGFSMETLNSTIAKVGKLGLSENIWQGSTLYKTGSELKDLIGIMFNVPEIKKNMKDIVSNSNKSVSGQDIANLTIDWVNGMELQEIAKQYFANENEVALTKCCKSIYSNLIHSTTWGLSSIQKLTGLTENIPKEKQKKINNLPAMIYYGVNTDEAILMRINNVPRSLASTLGKDYKESIGDIYKKSAGEAKDWIANLPNSKWDNAVVKKELIRGKDYKRVWNILNGNEQ